MKTYVQVHFLLLLSYQSLLVYLEFISITKLKSEITLFHFFSSRIIIFLAILPVERVELGSFIEFIEENDEE